MQQPMLLVGFFLLQIFLIFIFPFFSSSLTPFHPVLSSVDGWHFALRNFGSSGFLGPVFSRVYLGPLLGFLRRCRDLVWIAGWVFGNDNGDGNAK
jgi:hypothetical protein